MSTESNNNADSDSSGARIEAPQRIGKRETPVIPNMPGNS